jgi:hypothetical protein
VIRLTDEKQERQKPRPVDIDLNPGQREKLE